MRLWQLTEKNANAPARNRTWPKIHLQLIFSFFFPFPFLPLFLSLRSFACTSNTLFAVISWTTLFFRPYTMHNGDRDRSPSEAGQSVGIGWCLCCEVEAERIKLPNELAGDVACLGGSMVKHQPRSLGCRVRISRLGRLRFFFVSTKASLPIFLSPFPFPLPSTF